MKLGKSNFIHKFLDTNEDIGLCQPSDAIEKGMYTIIKVEKISPVVASENVYIPRLCYKIYFSFKICESL